MRHRLEVEEIVCWENGFEGWVTARWPFGASVTFFDPHFYCNRTQYVVGQEYDFVLAGIAYFLEVIHPEPIFITNPDVIRAISSNKPHDGTEADRDRLEVRLEGAAILIPQDHAAPDAYSVQAPVKDVEEFESLGRQCRRLRATVIRDTQEDDARGDKDIDIYVTGAALRGEQIPKVGNDVRGAIWLQGYLADSP